MSEASFGIDENNFLVQPGAMSIASPPLRALRPFIGGQHGSGQGCKPQRVKLAEGQNYKETYIAND